MRHPPVPVVFVAVLTIAIGATAGAVMSQLRPATEAFARTRIEVNRQAHGLTGSREYDDEVIARAVFTAEAGLSFLHTHAEGLGPLVLLGATLTASLVPGRRLRGLLHTLFAVGALFPLGYLVYGLAILERGRDGGVALAEGVYAWYSGPSFETPAEIRAIRTLGADAVGMSTVPEVILARFLGLKVAAVSVITNMAAGMSDEQISHEHTKAMAPPGAAKLERVLRRYLRDLGRPRA